MKKIVIAIIIVVVVFIGLLYWSVSSTENVFETSKLTKIDNIEEVDFRKHDSIRLSASTLYERNFVKTLMQGEQYRNAWAAEIDVPIVFLDTLFGGMKILEEGGGNQTHSLKLEAPTGIMYTLRSINKDPEPLIPEYLKTLGLENVVVDGISAQHPYGALLAAKLSDAVGILHTNPKIVFIPKQDILEQYNEKYGNRLYLLEYETEGDINWTNIENVYKILDTEDLQELKQEYPEKVSIDANALVRARLFDLIIGDWDRHTKQWGWVVTKNEDRFKAIPLAGDRDNAFFDLDGIVPSILSNKHVVENLRPFEDDIDFMPGLVYPFDRYFLWNVSEDVFIAEAKILQQLLTDEVIEASFMVWPNAITKLDAEEISAKIISRRDDLLSYAKEFAKIINEKGLLSEPLKGSEDAKISKALIKCFECKD